MSESDLGSDESRRAASLKRAVKRADRDHARWMRFYVMLLVVPIVIAIAILTAGRSDRATISAEVKGAVDPIRAELQGVRPELAVLTQQIRQLDGVREALDGVITANQKGLKALAEQIDQVQKLAGDGGALEELTKATKVVKDALEGHSKKILDLGSEREKLSELFEKNRKDIAAISALSGPEGELSKSVKALEARADEFGKLTGKEGALTKLDTATTKVQATLEGLTKKVDGLEGEGKRLGHLATTQQTSQVELRNQIEKVALLADPNKGDLARSIQGLKAQIQGLTASVGGKFDLKQLIDENKASRLAMQKATRQVAKLLGEGGEPKWARELKTGQSELKQQIRLLHDEFKRAPANAGALPPSEKTVVEAVAVLRLVNPPQFEGPAIGEVRFQRRDVVVVTVRVGKPDFVGLQPGRYHLLIHENGNCHQPIDDRNPGPFGRLDPLGVVGQGNDRFEFKRDLIDFRSILARAVILRDQRNMPVACGVIGIEKFQE